MDIHNGFFSKSKIQEKIQLSNSISWTLLSQIPYLISGWKWAFTLKKTVEKLLTYVFKTILVKLVQLINAPVLDPPCRPLKIPNIDVTVDGIIMLVRLMHPSNTRSSIVVTRGGIVKLAKLVQFAKQ